MEVTVNYQGILADNTGANTESISERGPLSHILDILKKKHPHLMKLSFAVAVNGVISHGEKEIKSGDILTLIPPAPGG